MVPVVWGRHIDAVRYGSNVTVHHREQPDLFAELLQSYGRGVCDKPSDGPSQQMVGP